MTVTGPRVRDFTGDAERFPVEVVSSPVFELALNLFTIGSMQDGSLADFTVGDEWLEGVTTRFSPELTASLEKLQGATGIWIELIGTVLSLPDPPTVEALVAYLRSADPIEIRFKHIIKGCMHCRQDVDGALQQSAASGDADAIEELNAQAACKLSDGLRQVLETDPAESVELIARTIELFDRDVFAGGAEIAGILERDANHKRALAKTMKAPELVELATNGITFEMQPEVDGIVLIPSIVIRPWVTIGSMGRQRFFCYPVAEEHLNADPDSPPTRLVEIYKALGDERRLRLMRILVEGPSSLAEITQQVDLSKSTVHHHLSILRQAGLVLITVGADKEYSLRQEAVPEAGDLLSGFLSPSRSAT